jgi:MIP family channel proteins
MPTTPLRSALIAEFLGTALLILLGDGVVASVVLLDKKADWIVITAGWALAVTLGVYLSGRLSGGHLNPAVTLALAVRGEFPWSRLGPYWTAQVAGAFAGAVLVYLDYGAAFAAFEQAHGIIRGAMEAGDLAGPAAGGAGVFATYPAFHGLARNLLSEFLGTAVLLLGVRTLTDRRNAAPGGYLEPLMIGALVGSIGLSLGGLTGYAINPARDFGPRLASALLGWGSGVFRSHGGYFWVPIVAPLAGGVCGTFLYDFAIGRHLPPVPEPIPPGQLSPGAMREESQDAISDPAGKMN